MVARKETDKTTSEVERKFEASYRLCSTVYI
jgi:hypothetical protein